MWRISTIALLNSQNMISFVLSIKHKDWKHNTKCSAIFGYVCCWKFCIIVWGFQHYRILCLHM